MKETHKDKFLYLVEPVSLSQKGILKGTSLRTYEIKLEYNTNKWGNTSISPNPTGKVFWLKNGKIIVKNTSARLNNKYLGWRNIAVQSNVVDISNYVSTVFTSPLVALVSKQTTMNSLINKEIKNLETIAKTLEKTKTTVPDVSELQTKHPEYFI